MKLTANHRGAFTFDLCHLRNKVHLETDDCFAEYPLQLVDGSYEVPVPSDQMEFHVAVRLPEDLTCERCVLRWTYRVGNNWGRCEDDTTALGCGPQETFKNCADVSIS